MLLRMVEERKGHSGLYELVHHAIVGDKIEALPTSLLKKEPRAAKFTLLDALLDGIMAQHLHYNPLCLQIKMKRGFEGSAVLYSLPFPIDGRHYVFYF